MFTKLPRLTDGQSVFLDALRAVAAQVVLFVHICEWMVLPTSPAADALIFVHYGHIAVMMFFALSGLLIALSINKTACHPNTFSFRTYAALRIARLYPTLIAGLAISGLVLLCIQTFHLFGEAPYALATQPASFPRYDAHAKLSTFAATALFLNGMIGVPGFNLGTIGMNGPLWSLAHEFWFYIFAGLLAASICNRSRSAVFCLTALLVWQIVTGNEKWLTGLVVWLAGASVAIWHNRTSKLAAAGISVFAIACICWPLHFEAGDVTNSTSRVVVGIGAVAAVAGGLRFTQDLRILPAWVASAAASFSFTLYVIHWPMIQLAVGVFGPEMYDWPLNYRLCLIAVCAFVINATAYFLSVVTENTVYWRTRALRHLAHTR